MIRENCLVVDRESALLREYKTLCMCGKWGLLLRLHGEILVKISTVPFDSDAHDFHSFSLVSSDRNFIRLI